MSIEREADTVPMRALGDLAATDFAAARSPDGRVWMAALPSMSRQLAHQWALTLTGEMFRPGYNAVDRPVTEESRPRARGAVKLVACDVPRGALLLERLDASRSLAAIPLAEAAATAGRLPDSTRGFGD